MSLISSESGAVVLTQSVLFECLSWRKNFCTDTLLEKQLVGILSLGFFIISAEKQVVHPWPHGVTFWHFECSSSGDLMGLTPALHVRFWCQSLKIREHRPSFRCAIPHQSSAAIQGKIYLWHMKVTRDTLLFSSECYFFFWTRKLALTSLRLCHLSAVPTESHTSNCPLWECC